MHYQIRAPADRYRESLVSRLLKELLLSSFLLLSHPSQMKTRPGTILAPSASDDPSEATGARMTFLKRPLAHTCVLYVYTRVYLASLFASFWSGNDYVTRVRDTRSEPRSGCNVYIHVS